MAQAFVNNNFKCEEEAICAYHSLGFKHSTIREFLSKYHDIDITPRTLRCQLKSLQLTRQQSDPTVSEDSLREAMKTELEISGGSVGYRQMWTNLRVKHHITVRRNKVAHYSTDMSVYYQRIPSSGVRHLAAASCGCSVYEGLLCLRCKKTVVVGKRVSNTSNVYASRTSR